MSWLYDIWYVLWYINSHTARKKKGESLCVSSKARVGWAVVLTRVEVPSPALLLGAYRFQSSKVDLSSGSASGLLASVSICLPHKTIAERPKVVRTRGAF